MKVVVAVLVALMVPAAASSTADLSGRWTLTLTPAVRPGFATEMVDCVFTHKLERLVIRCGNGTGSMFGASRDRLFVFRTDVEKGWVTFSGELDDSSQTLHGAWYFVVPSASFTRNGTFTGVRPLKP